MLRVISELNRWGNRGFDWFKSLLNLGRLLVLSPFKSFILHNLKPSERVLLHISMSGAGLG